MKILDFPSLRQTYNYDCGAVATQLILAYFGIDIREDKIIKLAKTNRKGTYIKNILKVFDKYHLKYKVGKFTIADIKHFLDKKQPVIIPLQAWAKKKNIDWKNEWQNGHYAVAIGYDLKKIYFSDPSSIYMTFLTNKEFKERWHDEEDKTRYINYGIAVFGKKRKYSYNKIIHMN